MAEGIVCIVSVDFGPVPGFPTSGVQDFGSCAAAVHLRC